MTNPIVKSSLLNINSPILPLTGNLRDSVLGNGDLLDYTCNFLGQQAVLTRAVSRDWNRIYSLKQAEVELRESYENMKRAKNLFRAAGNRFLWAKNKRVFLNKIRKKVEDNALRLIGGVGLSFAASFVFCVMEDIHCSNIFPMRCYGTHIYRTGANSSFLVSLLLFVSPLPVYFFEDFFEGCELTLKRSLREKKITQEMAIEKFQSIKTTFLAKLSR